MVDGLSFWLVLLFSTPVYWLLPRRLRLGFLALVSFGYLLSLEMLGTLGLLAWTLVFYFLSPWLARGRQFRRTLSATLILAIVGYLAYFKYIPLLLAAIATEPLEARLLVPLGISYYTFKLIHYAVETARGQIQNRSIRQFLCYMFLFPAFSAGPIERFDHFLSEQENEWSLDSTVEGLTRIVYGLIKKFVFADFFYQKCFTGALCHDTLLLRLQGLSTSNVWVYVVALYLYIYLDFSAYTDIAIGCSRLFGIRIMENFNFPVIARNIGDFWRRWHMTLSGWCLDYIYMPILGLFRRPTVALYAAFIVIGLWHAGTLLRLGWGLYHATGVLMYTIWSRFKRKHGGRACTGRAWTLPAVIVTQLFVCSSMVFLVDGKDYDIHGALRVLCKLVFIDI